MTHPPSANTAHPQNRFSIIGITVVFIALFFILRNLPNTQCDILHYEVTETTADGIEMCADGPAGMMDLNKVKFPGKLILHSAQTTQQGKSYHGIFEITGPKGDGLLPHEIAITHAEKIHLIAIDPSLGDYHHLHPTPVSNDSRWEFEFTPKRAGNYDIYIECVPVRTRKQLIQHTVLVVEATEADASTPNVSASTPAAQTNLVWDFDKTPIKAGSWVNFTLTLSDPTGAPIQLEKVMDAYSHVVAFREGTTGYAHIHPIESNIPLDPLKPSFEFTFYSGEKGNYRFWAQFHRNGEDVFISHDVEVL